MLLGCVSMVGPLSAHHSRAMFDVDVFISVEGVVTNVEWRNPHMWITLDVPTADGKTESWGLVATPQMARADNSRRTAGAH